MNLIMASLHVVWQGLKHIGKLLSEQFHYYYIAWLRVKGQAGINIELKKNDNSHSQPLKKLLF